MTQPLISLLHPSRGRPEKSFETVQKWIQRAGNVSIELIVSLDEDDPELQGYREMHVSLLEINKNRSAVDAINNAAKKARGNILIVVSDDTDCPENWAVDLLKCVEGKSDFIAKTNDGIQKWIITMPIMDRAYYNRFGYVYYPDYLHMFCDTELSCVADLTGRRVDIPLTFEHLHYSVGKSAKDSVSEKADATWSQGESLFLDRYKRNFDLKEINGVITSPQYLSWIASKL
jgi:hypothetical protein